MTRHCPILFLLTIVLCQQLVRGQENHSDYLTNKIKPTIATVIALDSNNEPINRCYGFFINSQGYLVTNYQSIKNAHALSIVTSNGIYPTISILNDYKAADMALLLVDIPEEECNYLAINNDTVRPNTTYYYYNSLNNTLQKGVLGKIHLQDDYVSKFHILQTWDKNVTGLPVLNIIGQVIGVINQSNVETINHSYAVTANQIPQDISEEGVKTLYEWNLNGFTQIAPPPKPDTSFDDGLNAVMSQDYKKAIEHFEQVVHDNKDHAEGWYYLGYCYKQMLEVNELMEAGMADSFSMLALAKPKKRKTAMAQTFQQHIYQQAIMALEKAIALKPNYIDALKLSAEIYIQMDLPQQAYENYQDVLYFDKKDMQARRFIEQMEDRPKSGLSQPAVNQLQSSQNFLAMGLSEKALKNYDSLIRKDSKNTTAIYNYGAMHFNMGRYQYSVKAFEELLKIDPHHVKANYYLGLSYYCHGEFGKATQAFKNTLKLQSNHHHARYYLGLSYLILNDYHASIAEYKQLYKLNEELGIELFNFIIQYESKS